MKLANHILGGLAILALASSAGGCGDENQVTTQRGMGNSSQPINNSGGSRRSGGGGGGGEEEDPESDRPDRPNPVLTRDDFSSRTRDPFHDYNAAHSTDTIEPVEVVRAERDVKLSKYTFDELKLIAIVNAGRSVRPTALFLAPSDNKSKSVKQGEYFSSAEVLLASVNRDCIEIEMVDPDLSPGWNMERGEQKLICLAKDN